MPTSTSCTDFILIPKNMVCTPKLLIPDLPNTSRKNLYYDCVDEEAPFGSDEGSDTLDSLEETIRKNPKLNFLDYPKYLIEHDWGMEYSC